MVSYRYTAHDPEGRRVDGHVEAETVEEARRLLEEEGLQVLEVMETEPSFPDAAPGDSGDAVPASRLSGDDAQELAENVAQLSAAGLPLSPGLRAAGDESDSPALARALYYLADQLDRGRSLDDVLESSREFMPAHLGGLIGAAARTSQMGPALTELMEHYRDTNELRYGIWRGLAYPFLVAGLATVILYCIVAFVAGDFEKIFDDFELELPLITAAFFWWREAGLVLLPVSLVVLVAIAVLLRWRLGAAGWRRCRASMPVVGPLWHWLGLLEWIGLMRVQIRYGATLLEALRLSADGVSDENVGRISRSLAEGIARGRNLSQMIAGERRIPASLVPLVRWGEEAGGLAEALEMGREMLEERVRIRSLWLKTALPPVLFIAIGCCVLLLVGALVMPLASLISDLT
jgi:type II secretory pathway component PulF